MASQRSQKKQKKDDSSISTGDEITDRDIFIEMSNKMTIVIEKLEDLTNTFNQKMDGLTTLLEAQKENSTNQVERSRKNLQTQGKKLSRNLKELHWPSKCK